MSEEKIPSPQYLSKLVNKNTLLNLSIASYFINILAFPDVSTWSTTGRPINKTIKNVGITRHHQKTVERMWHMVNKCKEMNQEYTGNNCTSNLNQPYLLSNPSKIIPPLWDILAYSIVQSWESGILNIYCYGFKGIRIVESELEVCTL